MNANHFATSGRAHAPRRSVQHRTRRLLVLAGALTLVVAAGCTEEQRRDVGEVDVREVLEGRVEQAVEDEGLEMDGDLSCSSDIGEDGSVTASCEGETSSAAAVLGTFAGTADVEDEHCAAQLVVTVGGSTVLDEADADCFSN